MCHRGLVASPRQFHVMVYPVALTNAACRVECPSVWGYRQVVRPAGTLVSIDRQRGRTTRLGLPRLGPATNRRRGGSHQPAAVRRMQAASKQETVRQSSSWRSVQYNSCASILGPGLLAKGIADRPSLVATSRVGIGSVSPRVPPEDLPGNQKRPTEFHRNPTDISRKQAVKQHDQFVRVASMSMTREAIRARPEFKIADNNPELERRLELMRDVPATERKRAAA